MTAVNRETAVAVLRRLQQGHPTATHWMNELVPADPKRRGTKGPSTARSRYFLHKLKTLGLVEGHEGRNGDIRWWSITEKGRQFLSTFGDNGA